MIETSDRVVERFGELSRIMLSETDIVHAWRVSFLANFFVGPLYRELDRKFGLSRPQFVILFSLSKRSGLVAREISLVTGLPKNSISRAVSQLLDAGYIVRETGDADKREKPLALTDKGRDFLQKIIPLFEERQANMRDALDDEERQEFDRLLMKIIDRMPNWVGDD